MRVYPDWYIGNNVFSLVGIFINKFARGAALGKFTI